MTKEKARLRAKKNTLKKAKRRVENQGLTNKKKSNHFGESHKSNVKNPSFDPQIKSFATEKRGASRSG